MSFWKAHSAMGAPAIALDSDLRVRVYVRVMGGDGSGMVTVMLGDGSGMVTVMVGHGDGMVTVMVRHGGE